MNYRLLVAFCTLCYSCCSQAGFGFKFKEIPLNNGGFYGIGVDIINEPEYLIKGPLGNEYDVSGNDGYGGYGYLGIRNGLNSYEVSLGGSAINMPEGNNAISVDIGGEYRRYLPVKPIIYFGANLQSRVLG
ncbi:hypothetical protein, partial [Vibrio sp. 10N.261.46.A3]|uniref:hypothetical protein n=1 Tax=Vibrio sp. 10N.261.46.A3 TaxID=3229658 RepID=UPI003551FE13